MQLIDRCNQIGMNPEHATIIAGFEQAVIQGTKNVFGHESRTQGCFSQSTWRKIQNLGHITQMMAIFADFNFGMYTLPP